MTKGYFFFGSGGDTSEFCSIFGFLPQNENKRNDVFSVFARSRGFATDLFYWHNMGLRYLVPRVKKRVARSLKTYNSFLSLQPVFRTQWSHWPITLSGQTE